MYLEFFDLQAAPFRITPDTRFFFLTQQYESALKSFQYATRERMGFMVLTGEVGTGKTLLTRQLLTEIDAGTETALLVNPLMSVPELLRAINHDFGIAVPEAEPQRQIEALTAYLLQIHTEGRTALLVIDESQNLSFEAFEMIRMLTNLETEHDKLLQILLVGQPELQKKLASYRLRQLRQRVTVQAALKPLSFHEMVRYIVHRITTAGGGRHAFFDPSAYRLVYQYTKGYPRLVNLLCDRSLLAAYTADTIFISKRVVRRAHYDLNQQFVPPAWQFWRRLGWAVR